MCGLIYIQRKDGKSAAKMMVKRYAAQSSRGSEGYGYMALDGNVVKVLQRCETEEEAIIALEKQQESTILFHHRMPTSTPNVVESTHPIKVSHESLEHDYYLIHNGIITNDDKLKKEHEALGFKYTTEMLEQIVTAGQTYIVKAYFNDSEALAIEFARSLESDTKLNVQGSIAFLALQVKKGTSEAIALYYGRNSGNPLLYESNKEYSVLASEGSGKLIEADTLYRYDYSTGETTEKRYNIGESLYGNYMKGYGYGGSSGMYFGDLRDEELHYEDRDFIDIPRTGLDPLLRGKGKAPTLDELEYDQYYETLLDEEAALQEQLADAKEKREIEREGNLFVELTALQRQIAEVERVIFADEAAS